MLRTRTKRNAPLLSPSTTIFVLGSWTAGGRRDDRLEVGDALGLHALAFRFLPLSVEHEPHALGLLLGLQLFLDGGREQRRQGDRPEQDLLGLDSARREGGAYVLEHVLRDELARTRVEELRLVLRGDVADDRAQLRIDDHAFEVAAETAHPAPRRRCGYTAAYDRYG